MRCLWSPTSPACLRTQASPGDHRVMQRGALTWGQVAPLLGQSLPHPLLLLPRWVSCVFTCKGLCALGIDWVLFGARKLRYVFKKGLWQMYDLAIPGPC